MFIGSLFLKMENVIKEYNKLFCRSWGSFSGHYYNVHCGCYWRYHWDRRHYINYRRWDCVNEWEGNYYINPFLEQINLEFVLLPKHYVYTQLVPELSYGEKDIVFWIWILKHFLDSNELRLMIIYRVMIE